MMRLRNRHTPMPESRQELPRNQKQKVLKENGLSPRRIFGAGCAGQSPNCYQGEHPENIKPRKIKFLLDVVSFHSSWYEVRPDEFRNSTEENLNGLKATAA